MLPAGNVGRSSVDTQCVFGYRRRRVIDEVLALWGDNTVMHYSGSAS